MNRRKLLQGLVAIPATLAVAGKASATASDADKRLTAMSSWARTESA